MSGGGGDDEGGHHGGAWKLAYADFVTAMMAFFILMWLLSSPKPSDVQGISDYFLKTPKERAEQDQRNSKNEKADKEAVGPQFKDSPQGPGAAQMRELIEQKITEEMMKKEQQKMEELKLKIAAIIEKDETLKENKDQISMMVTDEGLKIQLFDDKHRPMFDSGRTALKPYTVQIIRDLTKVLSDVDSRIALTGHTDAVPYGLDESVYSNWELSTDRANALRRELVRNNVPRDKILRVIGMGSSVPVMNDPYDAANRRIEILVLNKRAEQDIVKSELGVRTTTDGKPAKK
jgi:chemotaxis protein MotB